MNSNLVVDNTTGEVLITAPKPEPFINFRAARCPACGHGLSQWARFLHWILGRVTPVCVDPAWCQGGRPLSEKANPVQGMITGQTEFTYPCAGIEEQHLHYRCLACRHQWLVETKPAATR